VLCVWPSRPWRRVRLGFLRYEVTVILWMGEVEESNLMTREFRSRKDFKERLYNELALSNLYKLLTTFLPIERI
jgi:hypothetical protein